MKGRGKSDPVKIGFEETSLRIQIKSILPLRQVLPAVRKSVKYLQIAASIREVGIIEPPVVVRDAKAVDTYHLLDGHLRLDILRERGDTEVVCLVSTEDEAFTYNKRTNRIAVIQEHKMILNAIKRGVSEERLARAQCEHRPYSRQAKSPDRDLPRGCRAAARQASSLGRVYRVALSGTHAADRSGAAHDRDELLYRILYQISGCCDPR